MADDGPAAGIPAGSIPAGGNGRTAIVAMDANGLIGAGGGLPWRLPRDLRRFRELTLGHAVIMGRKTWDGLPRRPLPGRANIVLSRSPLPPPHPAGTVRASSLEEAWRAAFRAEAFVIGGAEVYAQALPACGTLLLTLLEGTFAGDAWFPGGVPSAGWRLEREERFDPLPDEPCPHRFRVLRRAD